jgi:signal transduction histidine kinase
MKEETQENIDLPNREDLYKSLLGQMPHTTILVFDKELQILSVDGSETEEIILPPASFSGASLKDLYAEKDENFIFLCQQALLGLGSAFEKEEGLKTFKIEIQPLLNGAGLVLGGMCIANDISEARQNQKELELRIEKLSRSNEELEQFAYVASHDLTEPLRKIRAFGERLASRFINELGPDGKDYIDRMQNAASRMQTLIDDLLAYSKLSRSQEENTLLSLTDIVNEVLSDLEITIEQKKAMIQVEELPEVMAIKGQMRQLFQNLISNALKFNAPGKCPVIHISSEIVSWRDVKNASKMNKQSKYSRITVQDSGIGFEEKFIDRIFVIFQRLHGRSEYAGTGIGLAVCKKIVENHNGSITASSKINEGAAFTITLPLPS